MNKCPSLILQCEDSLEGILTAIYDAFVEKNKMNEYKDGDISIEIGENHTMSLFAQQIEVKTDLKNLQVEDWELCKVFSNLIDNAITALEEKEEDKKIRIDMTEDREYYLFSVSNNGPMILQSIQEEIFKPGVTTKKESGHGMGLHIVQTVIKAYKGKLNLSSKEEETTFSFYFPKEERR